MNTIEEKQLLYKILAFVMSAVIAISIAVTGYFVNDNVNQINACTQEIQELKINAATVAGNRFTSSDFVRAKGIIDEQINSSFQRTLVLEEQYKSIKNIMTEIKNDVKELKSRN